ncbi:helix-turn-helix domain-containing protein [Ferrovibrio sp. MS7]|uniref:AraC family transcriptional regulator n=1 Tax=Ferrovibrio plantarum TaxID=3119164 RepID=UPI003135FF11
MTKPLLHPAQPTGRLLGQGRGWRLSEFVCRAGPGDRPFEERHDMVAIAAVLEGSFHYAADSGKALLHPGALMLGNPGSCYQCGHDHSTGDRCAGLHLAPELFAEIAAGNGGGGNFRFTAAMLPALPDVTRPLVQLLAAREEGLREEAVIALAEKVVSTLSGKAPSVAAPNARDHRRIDRVLRHIEAHAGEALDLDALSGIACMSKYHFLRCFRRITGVTPYDFLLRLRLRRAALKLSETPEPVSAIAYDSGFGDLSTFNHRFRGTFGESPSRFRARFRGLPGAGNRRAAG